jgi:hypothetical protein
MSQNETPARQKRNVPYTSRTTSAPLAGGISLLRLLQQLVWEVKP